MSEQKGNRCILAHWSWCDFLWRKETPQYIKNRDNVRITVVHFFFIKLVIFNPEAAALLIEALKGISRDKNWCVDNIVTVAGRLGELDANIRLKMQDAYEARLCAANQEIERLQTRLEDERQTRITVERALKLIRIDQNLEGNDHE